MEDGYSYTDDSSDEDEHYHGVSVYVESFAAVTKKVAPCVFSECVCVC